MFELDTLAPVNCQSFLVALSDPRGIYMPTEEYMSAKEYSCQSISPVCRSVRGPSYDMHVDIGAFGQIDSI